MGASTGIAGVGQGLYGAVRAVVLEALTRGVGEPLPTNVEYKSRSGIGAGTLQRAIDLLQEREALTVVSRGHLGRFIASLQVGECWQAAGLPPVRVLLPPLGPLEIDVLASRLADALTDLGVTHTVHHLRGGSGRLDALDRGEHDLSVVSIGTWEDVEGADADAGRGPDGRCVRRLAPGTYYAPGRLAVVSRMSAAGEVPRRVAIDRASPDHVTLTMREFPVEEGFDYVDAPFPRVPEWVLRGQVDAGIWHMTQSVVPLDLAGLRLAPLQRPAVEEVWGSLSGAALVGSRLRPELRTVIESLPLNDLRDSQQTALNSQSEQAADSFVA